MGGRMKITNTSGELLKLLLDIEDLISIRLLACRTYSLLEVDSGKGSSCIRSLFRNGLLTDRSQDLIPTGSIQSALHYQQSG